MKEGYDEAMKARLKKWRLFAVLAVLGLILSGCGEPFLSALDPAGEVAQTQFDLMILSTAIMVLVILVVVVVYVVAIFRFRRKKGMKTKFRSRWRGAINSNCFGRLFRLFFF